MEHEVDGVMDSCFAKAAVARLGPHRPLANQGGIGAEIP